MFWFLSHILHTCTFFKLLHLQLLHLCSSVSPSIVHLEPAHPRSLHPNPSILSARSSVGTAAPSTVRTGSSSLSNNSIHPLFSLPHLLLSSLREWLSSFVNLLLPHPYILSPILASFTPLSFLTSLFLLPTSSFLTAIFFFFFTAFTSPKISFAFHPPSILLCIHPRLIFPALPPSTLHTTYTYSHFLPSSQWFLPIPTSLSPSVFYFIPPSFSPDPTSLSIHSSSSLMFWLQYQSIWWLLGYSLLRTAETWPSTRSQLGVSVCYCLCVCVWEQEINNALVISISSAASAARHIP